MRSAPHGWPPGARTEPEALIKEARRRQRRRWLALGVAVAAVLAGVAGVAAGVAGHSPNGLGPRGHPRAQVAPRQAAAPTPIPRSIGTTLLMWPAGFGQCCGPVAVDNLSTGRLAQSQEPAIGAGDYQPLLAQMGRWLVYVGNGVVNAIRDDLTGHPRVLGPTPFFAPAATPGRAWLFQVQHGMQGPIRAWTVSLSGGPPSQPVTLPAGAYLPAVRGTDAGLLLQAPQGPGPVEPGQRAQDPAVLARFQRWFDATARAIADTSTRCTGCSTVCAFRQVTTDPLPRRDEVLQLSALITIDLTLAGVQPLASLDNQHSPRNRAGRAKSATADVNHVPDVSVNS
jgi:hypothetical protein